MLRMAPLKPLKTALTALALMSALAPTAWAQRAAPAAAPTPSPADASASGSEQLANQARYWERQNRYDLARENWLKLLRTAPDHPGALSGLTNIEAISGRAAAAQVYLDRLKEAHPNHPDIGRLESSVRQGNVNQDQLSAPRALARQGKYKEAVEAYRTAFGKEIPGGRLGLEYYQTLAGSEEGWEPARAGIAKIAADNPKDPIYQLALAQHLTYRESTRRQGIAQLATLSAQEASIAAPARQAWRQALTWLGAKRGDEGLYQDYLKRYGDDAQVSARLASIRDAGVVAARNDEMVVAAAPRQPTTDELRGKAVKEAFESLNDNQLDAARDRFANAAAQYGETADVLGGLGIIALRQQNYAEARDLLERASDKDKRGASRWAEALDTARFWELVRQAEAARKAGNNALAETELRRVISKHPKRAAAEPSVATSLADVLAEQGQLAEAEKMYRDLIRRDPENVGALRGLIGIFTRGKRLQEALALAESAPESVRGQLGSFSMLKAQLLREQASAASKGRDEQRAEALLKEALLLDPESPWTRLDLARIYQRQGRTREANTLVDALLNSAGASVVEGDVVYIKASLLAEQQDFMGGLQLLEKVPLSARTPELSELQKRLWVRYQAQRAGVYSKAGTQQEAQQILAEVEPFVGEMPELLGAVANAYADLGDEARALRFMQQALSRNPGYDPGLRLAYASLLFKLRQDTEFEVVMDDLLRRGKLSEQQNVDLANLRIGYRLRQADLVREEGDLARAYEYLEPLLRVNPNDPRLMMAMARLYADSKDHDKAYVIYERVLQQNDQEVDAYKGAITAALALNRIDEADAMLERAFAVDPNNPRLYAMAARAAKARGDEGRALGLFQQALRLDAEQTPIGAGGMQPSGRGNSQPLLQLVDPSSTYLYAPPRAGLSPSPPPALPEGRRFFKTRAGLALRDSAKKMVASLQPARAPTAQPMPAWLLRAKLRSRGDLALATVWQPAGEGFIKVSTPPRSGTASPATGRVDQPSGYWAQQPRAASAVPSYKYVETLSVPQSAPSTLYGTGTTLPSDFPAPRRVNPQMSQRLGGGGGSGSLRSELMGEIQALQDAQPKPGSGGTQSYTTAQPYGSYSAPQAGQRSGVCDVPRLGESFGTVYQSAPAPSYSTPYYSVPAPAPAPRSVETVPPPPPAVYRSPAPPVNNDPMLTRPAFATTTNRVDSEERRVLLKEISSLRAGRSPYAQAGMALRSRDGSEGLDRLNSMEAPVEIAFPAGEGGRFKVRAVPVFLDAGTVSGADLPFYGGLGLALALDRASPALRYSNSETGVATGLAYEAGDFKMDVGTTPLGFPLETVVGGINWRPKSENLSFKIDIARRSVTDSLLSYAGIRDPSTGFTWGGVTRNGGRLDAAYDVGRYGVYGNAGYAIYDGQNMPRNSSLEVGGGIYSRLLETRSNRVTGGINLTTFGYEKNLRRFSFGHGGYFSPQSYFAVSLPVEWEGFRNRFSYKLGGAIGVQAFRENGQSLYPSDTALQSALELALETYVGPPAIPGGYESQEQTGLGFQLAGVFEYLLDPNLAVGARLALDNARDYNEASASGYLRYMFYPQQRVSFPPNTLLPNFNFGDPRL